MKDFSLIVNESSDIDYYVIYIKMYIKGQQNGKSKADLKIQ